MEKCIQILDDKRYQVIQSWERVKAAGVEKIGVLLIKKMATISQELQKLYNFSDSQQFMNSPQMKKHYMKVLATINESVDSLKNPEINIIEKLSQTGAKEKELGMTKDYFRVLGRALLASIVEILGEDHTYEIEEAWVLFYIEVANYMISSHYDNVQELIFISDEVREDVLEVWSQAMVVGSDFIGEQIMRQIFTLSPQSLQLYSFSQVDHLFKSKELKEHFTKLIHSLDVIIRNVNDLQNMVVISRALG